MKPFCFLLFLFRSTLTLAESVPSGFPNKGSLAGSRDLYEFIQQRPQILKSVSPREFQFGSDQMAAALEKIGSWAQEIGRAPVWVGDISKKEGGKIALHLTHQRGLDADIGYLVVEKKNTGHRAEKFHNRFSQKWQLPEEVERDFALENNYRLLKNVVSNLDVGAVFVGCAIYDALERYDKKHSPSILEKVYAQKGHEDHFHLRIKCPKELIDCSEKWWLDPAPPQKKKKRNGEMVNGKWREC